MLARTLTLARRRPLAPFLLAATLAVDAWMLADVRGPGFMTLISEVGVLVALAGQAGLLGLWTAHRRRGWFLRWLVSVLACGLAAGALTREVSPSDWALVFVSLTCVHALTVVGLAGGPIAKGLSGGSLRGLRFSVADVVGASTVVAFSAATLRWSGVPWSAELFIPPAVAAGLTLAAWWMTRLARVPWISAALHLAIYTTVGAYVATFGHIVWEGVVMALYLVAPLWLVTTTWLVGLKVGGDARRRRRLRRDARAPRLALYSEPEPSPPEAPTPTLPTTMAPTTAEGFDASV